jgi:holin-like protein
MLAALTQLLVFQLAGEAIARGLELPLPGPVLGMLFLFLFLLARRGPRPELQATSQTLLQHLSLLASTAATLAVTALTMKLCLRRRPAPEDAP